MKIEIVYFVGVEPPTFFIYNKFMNYKRVFIENGFRNNKRKDI